MNDRELMKMVYSQRCADEMSAEELLEAGGRGAVTKSRRAAAAVAAFALGIGTALFVKAQKSSVSTDSLPADQPESIVLTGQTSSTAEDASSRNVWEINAVSMPDPLDSGRVESGTSFNVGDSSVTELTDSERDVSGDESSSLSEESSMQEAVSDSSKDESSHTESPADSQQENTVMPETSTPDFAALDENEKSDVTEKWRHEIEIMNRIEESPKVLELREEMTSASLDFNNAFAYYQVRKDDIKQAGNSAELKSKAVNEERFVPFESDRVNGNILVSSNDEAVGWRINGVQYETVTYDPDSEPGLMIWITSKTTPDISRFANILSFYPDSSDEAVFCDEFHSFYFCVFTSGGTEYVIPYCSVPNSAANLSDIPLNYSVYTFEDFHRWMNRKSQHSHPAINSVVYCDHSTNKDSVEMISSEQLSQIREWYHSHETDEVNVPANGSQGDHRTVPCRGTAYAGFRLDDGRDIVISRAYDPEDGIRGISVVTTTDGDQQTCFFYSDDVYPDISVITDILDGFFG